MRGGVWKAAFAMCAGALVFAGFGCTHRSGDAVPGEDVAKPSESGGDAPPVPPDPLGPPQLPPSGSSSSGGSSGGGPPPPAARVFFGVDEAGMLVRFEETAPDKATAKPITGLLLNERILGIDFRPSNKLLYGLGSSSRLYKIDPETAAASAIGMKPFTPALAGQSFGFDFDPASDGARVHSDVDQDMTLDPDLGTVAGVDPDLTYATDDVNAFQHLNVVGTAFTAKDLLYAIDSTRNLLVHISDPYSGRAATVGPLGVMMTDVAGFDIAPTDEAYAAMRVGDATGLYAIDLTKGTATLKGKIAVTTGLHGLAIQL
jgi:hypothetical protein